MKYRLIPFQYYNPYFKTGLNQALMESVEKSREGVIFLSGWAQDTVNIGYSQTVEEEVDMREVERRNVAVVRRQGGGGTTYLTRDGEITWGVIAPESEFPEDINKTYEKICGELVRGLKTISIEAEHEPINDIVTSNGKISGATTKKKNGIVYTGGTLMYQNNPEEMFTVLTPDEDKLRDKRIKDFKDRVTSVVKESDASFKEAVNAVRKGLSKEKNITESKLKDYEKNRAEELAKKYRSDEWIYRGRKE